MEFDKIDTSRLILRKIDEEVYRFVFKTYDRVGIKSFFGHQNEQEYLRDKKMNENGISTFNKDMLMFHLIDKESNLVIGWCGYHTWYVDHHRAEIGCGFTNSKFHNKGLMTEALEVILDYGFSQMKLNRIEAMISPTNTPSLKLFDRVKFKREGLLKAHYLKDGIYEDSIVFSLLRSDYLG